MLLALRLFVFCIVFHVATCYADVYVIDSPLNTTVLPFRRDTYIANGIEVSADLIKIEKSVLVENYGMINSDISVGDKLTLYFKNAGTFSGDVVLGNNADLVQIIKSDDDMRPLNISVNYSVATYGDENLSLGRLIASTVGADKIRVYNTRFILDDIGPVAVHDSAKLPDVELHGDIVIYIHDYAAVANGPLLRNVSGDGAVHVYSDNIEPLYMLGSYVADGNLFVHKVRMTDYAKILGNATGKFLNSVRDINPNDSLLRALDGAESMDGLHKIMNRSASLHPVLFMRYADVIDSFNIIGAFDFSDSLKVSAEPVRVFSDDLDSYGLRVNFDGIKFSGVDIALSAYGALLDFADDINEFSAMLYGANIRAGYAFENNMFVRGLGGMTIANFETGPVFDGDGITYNPVGKSMYATADAGMNVHIGDKMTLAPFIGFDLRRFSVLHEDDFVLRGRIGADIKYSFEFDGLRYDYVAEVLSDHSGHIGGALRVGAWSIADDAGGDVSVAVIDDEFAGRTYKFSIGGRFRF